MSDEPVIRATGLKKYYPVEAGFLARFMNRGKYIRAVDDVDIEIPPNEVLGIVGESGSGKSTLGELLMRLEEPTEGTIRFKGTDVTGYSARRLRKEFRRDAQIIFQDPYESLNPKKTVFNTISEPLRNYHDWDREEYEERVTEMLYDLGLRPPSRYLDMYPDQLSGGQRQRINIGKALILEPDFLVADEPLSMLDVSIQAGILKILDRLQSKLDFSLLYISHDLSVVKIVADEVGVMYRGQIVEQGETDRIIDDPKHPYTQALIASLPDLDGDRERVLLPDDPTDETTVPSGCRFHPRCPDRMEECSQNDPALAEVEERDVRCFLYHEETKES